MIKIRHIILLLFLFMMSSWLFGQDAPIRPTRIEKAVYFDISPPIRDVRPILTLTKDEDEDEEVDEVKNKFGFKQHQYPDNQQQIPSEDPVWQKQDGTRLPQTIVPLVNFEGVNNLTGVYPPDTQGDVSTDKYVQVVNCKFAVYSKAGALLMGPLDLKTIWAGIPAPWNGTNSGDPIVLYDQAADRWLIAQFSLPSGSYTQYAMTVAVSVTNDPTGSWYRYVFQYNSKMPDYPKFGVWPDAYYLATNQFETSAYNWAGQGASAFQRSKMLTGDPTAAMVYFDLGAAADPGGMLPSDWDGTNLPVANEPNHFIYFNNWSSASLQYLRIWDFHVDWTTPGNSTFAQVASLTTATFDASFCGVDGGNCIPQPVTTRKLATLSDRLMYRLQYRNFGDHRSMVTNHTVDVNGADHAGVRWYELRNTGSGWSIYQQGTYAPDAAHRWMASIAMNSIGDMAMGYSVSDNVTVPNVYPSIRYTGRKAADPLGTMTMPEQTIISGSGYQTGSASRWGDYSMMSVDPSDDATFWYTTEYIQTTGIASWQTRVASFVFTDVPAVTTLAASSIVLPTATLNGTINPNSAATTFYFQYGTTTAYGSSTPVLSAGSGAVAVPVYTVIPGLQEGFTYHFRLVATNANGTTNGSDMEFTIPCGSVFTIPFIQPFSGTTIPTCWSQRDYKGSGQIWNFGTITGSYPGYMPLLTGNYAYLNSDAYGIGLTQNADLVSPKLDFSGFSSVTLSFSHYYRAITGQTGTLSYSVDDGLNWVTIQVLTATTANPATFSMEIPGVALQSQVRFKWNLTGTWGWYWCINNVQVNGIPVNRVVTNVSVPGGSTNCYNASQNISLAGSGTYFNVLSGGSVTLIAGSSINMLPGTVVYPGGYLWGYIAPSGPFCTSPSYMANQGDVATSAPDEVIGMQAGNLMKVYPNPTTGDFTIELKGTVSQDAVRAEIFDNHGVKILTKEFLGQRILNLSLSGSPVGLYFVRVYSGESAETVKVVKY